jgi:hypothetical protein
MPNSVKARLKKLEDRVQVFAPNDPQKVCYLLVSRMQYEEAMAILLPSSAVDLSHDRPRSRLVLIEEDWRNNDKLVIVELE